MSSEHVSWSNDETVRALKGGDWVPRDLTHTPSPAWDPIPLPPCSKPTQYPWKPRDPRVMASSEPWPSGSLYHPTQDSQQLLNSTLPSRATPLWILWLSSRRLDLLTKASCASTNPKTHFRLAGSLVSCVTSFLSTPVSTSWNRAISIHIVGLLQDCNQLLPPEECFEQGPASACGQNGLLLSHSSSWAKSQFC